MDDEQRHIIKATRVFGKPNLFSASLGRQTYKQAATEMAAVRCFFSQHIQQTLKVLGFFIKEFHFLNAIFFILSKKTIKLTLKV